MAEVLNNFLYHLRINFFSFFDSFSTSKYFAVFEVNFLLRLDSLAAKSVLVFKFACTSLPLKTLAAELLKSGVAIYLSWLWSVIFFFNLSNFCVIICFYFTKLLTLAILFSTAVNAVFVAKLLTCQILFFNSVIFFLARSITSGIFFSNPVLSVWYFAFKTKSLVTILFSFAASFSYVAFLTTSFFYFTTEFTQINRKCC